MAVETKAAQNLNEGTFDAGESITVLISNYDENDWTPYTFTTGAAVLLALRLSRDWVSAHTNSKKSILYK